MKKTLTVNLGGAVYHIDEDAYRLLDDYLNNLRLHFRKQEGAEEIVNDMENRIAELFSEKITASKQVITIVDVEEVIARMGTPEDFGESNESTDSSKAKEGETKQTYYRTTAKRRCFRDPDNKMLGGVAAGLAAYFGWDPTIMRIVMIVLIFLPYCPMILMYLACWIFIPEARTAAEKLSMRGEAVTVENIGKTVTDGFERVADGVNNYVNSGKPRSFLQKAGDVFVTIVAVLLKIVLVAAIIVFCPVLFLLAIVLVALVVALVAVAVGGGALLLDLLPSVNWMPLSTVSPLLTVAGTIAGILLIGIPLAGLAYAILRQLFHWQPMGNAVKWTLLILWILGLILFVFNLSALGWQLPLYGLHTI